MLQGALCVLSAGCGGVSFLVVTLVGYPRYKGDVSSRTSRYPGYKCRVDGRDFFPGARNYFLRSVGVKYLVLIVVFLFDVVLSRCSVPRRSLPVVNVVAVVMFKVVVYCGFFGGGGRGR